MGTTVHLIVVGGPAPLLDQAEARVEQLEARWSRFRPDSELCRLNAAAGRPAVVSDETFAVVQRAVEGWRHTEGRFDPTVFHAMVAAGYDRTFPDVANAPRPAETGTKTGTEVEHKPAPGCAGIDLAPSVNAVTLPPGVALDLGGIGKGYAADLIANHLIDGGAEGACVSIGGDLRCMGTAPWDEGWLVDIEDPHDPDRDLMRLTLGKGAVATTTRTKRVWGADNQHHHVINPATGAPARTQTISATAFAEEAWWAEVLSKSLFLGGPADKGGGFTVDDNGEVHEHT
ncbi:MAG TPA: FAD:protein FMN transferase [Acidimicrobiales bacterium]|jgi:thiamine biosynthesis lipoprotein|nr:FAD:protein FMN transferase [Acidimicrobiales bacterium]